VGAADDRRQARDCRPGRETSLAVHCVFCLICAILSPSRRLEAAGVIARYAAIVDPRKVGLGLTAHLEVMLDKQAEHARSTFRKAVQKWPEALTVYALSGQWDDSLKVVAPDLDHYARFLLEKVLALPVVVNVQSSFVLETVKETTALPLDQLGAVRGA
jgi:Lrp/AsnC family leucine-responsive transcriptional regulator